MVYSSLLDYYQENRFNPVPISLEDSKAWELHFAKRRNLYERHLGIPLSFLQGRPVLEFGCNSGENALVLASIGAKLTLVEPNEQVMPRLKASFKKFGLERNMAALINSDIAGFKSQSCYDAVLAEGFLNTVSDRDEMFLKICGFIRPGGIGVISFDDRYGSLLEVTRQLILKRACRIKGIVDLRSDASLGLARDLYEEDFAHLSASRPFEAWWKDAMINPFVAWKYFWSYQKIIPLLEKAGCEFHSSSPGWAAVDSFSWYKDVPGTKKRHKRLLEDWHRVFSFFLTGLPVVDRDMMPATAEVVEAVSRLIKDISAYVASKNLSIDSISYPQALDSYFTKSKRSNLSSFNKDMKMLFNAVRSSSIDDVISGYKRAEHVRSLWGTPCHYIRFGKLI